jgi:branched-chain amino acid transport system substrate-binding protein
VDYLNMIDARDGGINGVRITFEECETGYSTDRGVECYERLKGKGPTGAAVFNPLSTGITFALTEKAYTDKIPIITMGYGRSESVDGRVFPWNFPLLGTYWTASDILVQHVGNLNGGLDKLKGKKIALIYHDSPYGKEPIPLLERRAKMHGFKLLKIPVTHPGVEQRSAWLQVRQNRPDYVFLWGWGIMNSTAIREAVAVRYPRDQMYGVWWAGAEPDVIPAGKGAIGYNSITLQHSSGRTAVHADILKYVYAKGKGAGREEDVGHVLYNRGLINAVLSLESIRTAQGKYGDKSLTGEQVRWGIENLDIDTKRIKALGLEGMMQPLKVTCSDHEGVRRARIHQWTGSDWKFVSDWIEADNSLLRPMVDAAAANYAKEKGITPVICKA